jgi:hypothetical protein
MKIRIAVLGCCRATVYNVLGDTTTHRPLDAAE